MELLLYAGKVALLWAVCLLCYMLFLRRHTFFQWNRLYLLLALTLSLALPLLHLPEEVVETSLPSSVEAYVAWPEEIPTLAPVAEKPFDWLTALGWVYGLGLLVMLARLLWQLTRLWGFIRQGDKIPMDDFTLILVPDQGTGSFSFGKWVVINERDYAEHFDFILSHELVHVRQRHSLDILLVEVLRVVFWFNPLLWLYKCELQALHELLADRQATQRDRYAQFLVAYALGAPLHSLGHPFYNGSTLKHRIAMLYKNRTSPWALSRYLLVLPLVALVVVLTAARVPVAKGSTLTELAAAALPTSVELPFLELSQESATTTAAADSIKVSGSVLDEESKPLAGAVVVVKGTTIGTITNAEGDFRIKLPSATSELVVSHVGYHTVAVSATSIPVALTMKRDPKVLEELVIVGYAASNTDSLPKKEPRPSTMMFEGKEVFMVVEQMPEYPEGIQELYTYLAKNIRYPAEAVEAKVEGKVFVQFMINEQGYVRSPRVVKGLGFGLDEEAQRVVLGMPRWKPGWQGGKPVAVLYNLPISFRLASGVTASADEDEKIFTVVEQQPEFPGGTKALYAYISSAIRYPEPAKRAQVEGKVFVRFVVDKSGAIRNIEILKGTGFGLDEEAIRVMKAMPAWKPGRQGGQPVNVRYNLPIDFRLNNSTAKVPETIRTSIGADDIISFMKWTKPLWIVDGKPISQEEQRHVTPDQVESITVDKSDQSALYGERAKDGVIRIITKKEK